ncbi:hypothetical protein [Bifidobacterium felsineum]|uniref:hypothetical protein n=1 Tax=Bifidobacterium felsineum TaxID=2045440 RepID=UPI001BDC89FE|nr:hypothetical protein [Bifidobacterium felsineum]MBT1164611.1 hypothetical protein [Bifidobacterium felsineum]
MNDINMRRIISTINTVMPNAEINANDDGITISDKDFRLYLYLYRYDKLTVVGVQMSEQCHYAHVMDDTAPHWLADLLTRLMEEHRLDLLQSHVYDVLTRLFGTWDDLTADIPGGVICPDMGLAVYITGDRENPYIVAMDGSRTAYADEDGLETAILRLKGQA